MACIHFSNEGNALQTGNTLVLLHRPPDSVPPIIVKIGNCPTKFLAIKADAEVISADLAEFLVENVLLS